MVHPDRENDLGNSDHGNFIEELSGKLRVNITPFSKVEFLLVEPESSLSECTALCQCEERGLGGHEKKSGESDQGNVIGDVSGTLGVYINSFLG